MNPEFLKAALEAQGVKAERENLPAHAARLQLQLRTAALGFARLGFEDEPGRFLLEQCRSDP